MTETFIELTEDEFDAEYSLVVNHINPSATWAIGDGPGHLFNTYGEELSFVGRQNPRTIWTLVDGDDGDMYLISGFHFVNRVGYILTTTPVPTDTMIQVHLPLIAEETPSSSTD